MTTCPACAAIVDTGDRFCEACGARVSRDNRELVACAGVAVTDRGLRHRHNEDAFSLSCADRPDGAPTVVAVVCDGVSTSPRADQAAQTASVAATEALTEAVRQGLDHEAGVLNATATAAKAVAALGRDASSAGAPSCTFVCAVVDGESVTIGWLGDSRAYWLAADVESSRQLTADDSWGAEQVAAGHLSTAAAASDPRSHAITRWLGADADEVTPRIVRFSPGTPGMVLLCTDGMWHYTSSADAIAVAVADAAKTPLIAARRLVERALAAGGHDNITVALIPVPVQHHPHHQEQSP